MAIVVRNTFLHFNKHANDDAASTCTGRSSSAPPRRSVASSVSDDASSDAAADQCRNCDEDWCSACDDEWCNARSESWETDTGNDACSNCGWETDTGSDDEGYLPDKFCSDSLSTLSTSPEMAQRQLDAMSQEVMHLWSQLSSVESRAYDVPAPSDSSDDAAAKDVTSSIAGLSRDIDKEKRNNKQTIQLEAFFGDAIDEPLRTKLDSRSQPWRPDKTLQSQTRGDAIDNQPPKKLDSRCQPFRPGTRSSGEIDTVLASAQQAVATTHGVVAAEIMPGCVGTLATLSIKLMPGLPESTKASITAITQAALLEAATWSKNVYVLGYEEKPFENCPCGTGFSAALAMAPTAWDRTACWDTYQKGCCPRGPSCKWQHPGRDKIQPIRVVFH